ERRQGLEAAPEGVDLGRRPADRDRAPEADALAVGDRGRGPAEAVGAAHPEGAVEAGVAGHAAADQEGADADEAEAEGREAEEAGDAEPSAGGQRGGALAPVDVDLVGPPLVILARCELTADKIDHSLAR